MQSQNKHIEDLVRQAAASNPVKAKGADWDNVLNRLSNKEKASAKAEEKSKKYLFLLMFLLSSLICNEFYYILYSNQSKNSFNNKNIDQSIEDKANSGFIYLNNGNIKKFTSENLRTLKNYRNPVYTYASTPALESGKQIMDEEATNEQTESHIRFTETGNENIAKVLPDHPVTENFIENLKEIAKPAKQEIPVKTQPAKQKRLYGAFLLGPDISTVKFSEIKAAGHSVGLTAGTNLTKRFSIETGAFLNQKKYVAEGEYFKAEKLYLPDHSKLLNVSGYCNMIEIPLNIRYNIATNKNYNVFALAGSSSYLVQKENYDYEYTRYNNLYSGKKSYKQSSNELFNVVNLAAGFEKRVGKATALRIEPYVKLPVRGMGVGDMRLSSAGVLVGVRYPF